MFWNIAPFDFVYNKKYESFTGLFALFVLLLNSGLLLGTVSMIGKHSWKRRKMKNVISNASTRNRRQFGPKQVAISEFFSSFGQEVKLTIYGVFLLLCFLMTFAFVFIPYVYDEVLDVQVVVDLKIMVLNLSMDIFGVVNPFGLVLMSTA